MSKETVVFQLNLLTGVHFSLGGKQEIGERLIDHRRHQGVP